MIFYAKIKLINCGRFSNNRITIFLAQMEESIYKIHCEHSDTSNFGLIQGLVLAPTFLNCMSMNFSPTGKLLHSVDDEILI